MIATENPDGSINQNSYDAVGNVIGQTDGDGNLTQYVYDSRNQPIETINADGTYTSTTYNGAGKITSQTDALGHATLYSYDLFGRNTTMQLPATTVDGGTDLVAEQWQYTYDIAGNLIQQSLIAVDLTNSTNSDTNRTTTYEYNSRNQLVEETDPAPNDPLTGQSEAQPRHLYDYDAVGNLETSATTA